MNRSLRLPLYGLLLLLGFYFIGGLIVRERQRKLFYKPVQLAKDHSFDTPLAYKEFNIPVRDSQQLNILLFPADSAEGQVLFFHNYRGNMQDDFFLIPFFLKKKYNVFLMDYPGYGKSDGIPEEGTINQSAEILYQLANQYFPPDSTLVSGEELGAAPASLLATHHPFKQLILINPFYDFSSFIQRKIPLYPLKETKDVFPVNKYLKTSKAPVLIFYEKRNKRVPEKETLKLAKEIPADGKFILLEDRIKGNFTEDDQFIQQMEALFSP